MVTVILHGSMKKAFRGKGKNGNWHLNVQTPVEAIQAIEANRGGMRKFLIDQDKKGIEYRILVDGQDFEHVDELTVPMGEHQTFEIIPVLAGEGQGLWQIIAGVVLIIVGVILSVAYGAGTPVISIGAKTLTTGVIASALFAYGAGLVLGGIANLVFSPTADNTQGGKNRPSYLFNGQVNNTTQGDAIPLCYGELIVGSQVISAYLSTVQVDNEGNVITGSDPGNSDLDGGGSKGGPYDRDKFPLGPVTQNSGFADRLLPSTANEPGFVPQPTVIPLDEFSQD